MEEVFAALAVPVPTQAVLDVGPHGEEVGAAVDDCAGAAPILKHALMGEADGLDLAADRAGRQQALRHERVDQLVRGGVRRRDGERDGADRQRRGALVAPGRRASRRNSAGRRALSVSPSDFSARSPASSTMPLRPPRLS